MKIVSVDDLDCDLPDLNANVEAGEKTVLGQGGVPFNKLVPGRVVPPARHFGAWAGVLGLGPEFFEPLPEDELAAWE